MAGYSGRPLAEKLGLKEGRRNGLLNSPGPAEKFFGTPLPHFNFENSLTGKFAFLQFFTTSQTELAEKFPDLKNSLEPGGALWISWPKGTSQIQTDINENIVREIGLRNGLVDVKVVAIDEDWSGLKFVYRLKDR